MTVPTTQRPSLHSGDRLTRAEFHRRYRCWPEDKKAELVEGVVYVASPVSAAHAKSHADIVLWLGTYRSRHPDITLHDNVTVFLDPDNEVQPDACLWREAPGDPRLNDDGYVEGAPQLVVEVARQLSVLRSARQAQRLPPRWCPRVHRLASRRPRHRLAPPARRRLPAQGSRQARHHRKRYLSPAFVWPSTSSQRRPCCRPGRRPSLAGPERLPTSPSTTSGSEHLQARPQPGLKGVRGVRRDRTMDAAASPVRCHDRPVHSAPQPVPGDRLTRAEFHRRSCCWPDGTQAESDTTSASAPAATPRCSWSPTLENFADPASLCSSPASLSSGKLLTGVY